MINPITTTVVSGNIGTPERNDIDETLSTSLSAKGKLISNNQQIKQVENSVLEKTLLVGHAFSGQNSNNVNDLNVIQRAINILKTEIAGSIKNSLKRFNSILNNRDSQGNQSESQEKKESDSDKTKDFEQIIESYIKLFLVKFRLYLGENANGLPLRVITFYQLTVDSRIVFKQYFSLFSYEKEIARKVSSKIIKVEDRGEITEEIQPVKLVSSGETYTKDWLYIEAVNASFSNAVQEMIVVNRRLKMRGFVLDFNNDERSNLPELERLMYMPGFYNSW